jgi:hypothetical protein
MNAPAITHRESLTGFALSLAVVFVKAVAKGGTAAAFFIYCVHLGVPCKNEMQRV